MPVAGRIIAALRAPATAFAAAIVVLALLVALFVPVLHLPDPAAMDATPLQPPGTENWFGTDNFGRDLLARIAWGTRVAILVAVCSAAFSTIAGLLAGGVAGFYGGWIDALLSRVFDVVLLIPTFFLILVIVSLFGSSLAFTIIAISITTWPRSARIMRAQVLTLKSRMFVQAAIASGATRWQALARHVVPNALPPLITDSTLLMGVAILTEAGLSFLGLGDQELVSWGRLIFEGQRYLRIAPWMAIIPGIAMLLLVASLNLLGDALNQQLNPRLRRRHARHGGPRRIDAARVPPPSSEEAALALSVREIRLGYHDGEKLRHAVDGVSFRLAAGESLGVVGESGCGKSSLASALLQILPANAAIGGGTVVVGGQTVLQNGATVMAGRRPVFDALRWKHLSIVFQSAMSSLNPVMRVGVQLMEAMRLHRPDASRAMVRNRVLELFDMIGIPRDRFSAYPFELSGGMRQRVMIALALLLEPKLVIADEPTTALDVVIQHQVLREISALRERLGLSLILISHDMGAVATTCDRIAVMYAGEIVEIAPTPTIFEDSRHPYTRALIQAAPSLRGPRRLLASIPGEPISAGAAPAGCRFSPRCAFATELCRSRKPELTPLGAAHFSACHYAENLAPQKRAEAAA